MAANQTQFLRLKQRSVIKFLVAEKYKPYEIYRRMCDLYRKAFFFKFYKSAKYWFAWEA